MMRPMFPVPQPGVEGESEIINMSESVANFPRNFSMVGNPRQHPSASVQAHQTNHVLYTRCRDVVMVSSRILIDIVMSILDVDRGGNMLHVRNA